VSQTLDRGLRVLELVAAEGPVGIDGIAAGLELHRSIVYRLVRTLEDHRLVERDEAGRYRVSVGVAVLARSVQSDLRSAAAVELARLADSLAMTAFLVVRDGDEAATVDIVEPRRPDLMVTHRPGLRHPIERGAPGLALLAGQPFVAGERTEVSRARRRGWCATESEVLPGMAAVAAPIADLGALAVLWLARSNVDRDAVGTAVAAAARAVAERCR
jgi:DNA-binding IclR family transcriptional regulator